MTGNRLAGRRDDESLLGSCSFPVWFVKVCSLAVHMRFRLLAARDTDKHSPRNKSPITTKSPLRCHNLLHVELLQTVLAYR